MSTCRLLFQWACSIKIQLRVLAQYKADIVLISFKCNLFSPWYSWIITELALSNNHSLTRIALREASLWTSVWYSLIYNRQHNRLMLRVRVPPMWSVLDTTFCNEFCRWFSLVTPVTTTKKPTTSINSWKQWRTLSFKTDITSMLSVALLLHMSKWRICRNVGLWKDWADKRHVHYNYYYVFFHF